MGEYSRLRLEVAKTLPPTRSRNASLQIRLPAAADACIRHAFRRTHILLTKH